MSINLCVFSGNIGGDCEQKYLQSGACVANFSLPVKQGYGEHEKTSWVRCILLGKKAESLPQYLQKGSKVTVTGEFVLNEWTDHQGNKRSTPELIVRDLDLPPRQQAGNNPAQQPQGGYQQPNYHQPASQQQRQAAQPSPMANNPTDYNQQQAQNYQHSQANHAQQQQNHQAPAGVGDFDDNIPFATYLKNTFI